MSPRQMSESTRVVLVPQRHQGVPPRPLTTETTTCFQGRRTTSTKLRLEMRTQVTCRQRLSQLGLVMKTIENLPGSRPAREDRHGRARVMFQRGTRICRRELRCQCRPLKNLSLILFTRSLLMVNNSISTFEFCLFCNPPRWGCRQTKTSCRKLNRHSHIYGSGLELACNGGSCGEISLNRD